MVDRLKGQHKNYAETGVVEGQGSISGVQSFGAAQHNHRDGGALHNDGKHRQPRGMHDGRRGIGRAGRMNFAGDGVDHGPWEVRGAK